MMLFVKLLYMLMILLSNLSLIRHMKLQQLELAAESEFDLQDNVIWGRKWLVDFNAGKTQLVLFDHSDIIALLLLI